tara:strand:+ start:532 stop:1353 length:822 start_codon:yes stop_codon:yes gene_type:complete
MTKNTKPSYQDLPESVKSGMSEAAWNQYQPGADTPKNALVPNIFDEKGGMDLFTKLLKEGALRIDGQVEDGMASVFTTALFLLEEQGAPDIKVFINSPGGSVIAGLAMYDAMRNYPGKITTVVSGMAASMGSILLAAGDERLATPNARVMIHQPSGGGQGTATSTRTNQDLIEDMWDDLTNIYVAHTGVEHEVWDGLLRAGDVWLKPEKAKTLGLVQHITTPKKPAPFANMKRKTPRAHFNQDVVPKILEQVEQRTNSNDNKGSAPAAKPNTP